MLLEATAAHNLRQVQQDEEAPLPVILGKIKAPPLWGRLEAPAEVLEILIGKQYSYESFIRSISFLTQSYKLE